MYSCKCNNNVPTLTIAIPVQICGNLSQCRNEEIRVIALMILSQLCTESEAKSLLNESALSLLVGFLAKSVRNELPQDNSKWGATRRSSIIRTLEKLITSDEGVVPELLKLDILTLLAKALDSPGEAHVTSKIRKTEEVRATLTCLWTLSQNADALQLVARNASLVKSTNDSLTKLIERAFLLK